MRKFFISIAILAVSYFIFHDLGFSTSTSVFLAILTAIALFVSPIFNKENSPHIETHQDAAITSSNNTNAPIEDPPTADFLYKNISINTKTEKLWMRDVSGKTITVDKGNVLRWSLSYKTHPGKNTNNRIEIHIRDLNQPMWVVPFDKYGDGLASNARKNFADAEEWMSRLTTWVKST